MSIALETHSFHVHIAITRLPTDTPLIRIVLAGKRGMNDDFEYIMYSKYCTGTHIYIYRYSSTHTHCMCIDASSLVLASGTLLLLHVVVVVVVAPPNEQTERMNTRTHRAT